MFLSRLLVKSFGQWEHFQYQFQKFLNLIPTVLKVIKSFKWQSQMLKIIGCTEVLGSDFLQASHFWFTYLGGHGNKVMPCTSKSIALWSMFLINNFPSFVQFETIFVSHKVGVSKTLNVPNSALRISFNGIYVTPLPF